MIEFLPPKGQTAKEKEYEQGQSRSPVKASESAKFFTTRKVQNKYPTIGDLLLAHFEVIVQETLKNKNSQLAGAMLEICLYDAFRRSGIDPIRILRRVDPSKRIKSIDLDYVITGTAEYRCHMFCLKTSFRERWKQFDRDFFLTNMHYMGESLWGDHASTPHMVAVKHQEKAGESLETTLKAIQNTHSKLVTPAIEIVTIRTPNVINRIIEECGGDAKLS